MSLRIEVCNSDYSHWNLCQKVLPGQNQVIGQILNDGDKFYIANCDTEDEESIIYESKIPADEFRKKITEQGVYNGKDFREKVTIKKGQAYTMSIKEEKNSPRLVVRFLQE